MNPGSKEWEREALRRWWHARNHSVIARRWCRYYLNRLNS